MDNIDSGVKARITSVGLNYAKDVALEILAQRIGDVHIPNQSGSEGPVDYYLTKCVDAQGRPKLSAKSCSCDMGHVSISFHGGASSIYNLFSGYVADSLKGQLQNQLCQLVTQAINDDANKALATLPVTVDIDSVFLLDYRLVSNATFTPNYIETYHKGEIYWAKSKTEAPFTPAPFPQFNETSKMLYLWVSDYTFNSIAYQAQNNQFLQYNLTQNDLPDSVKPLLNTTCSDICIGKIIPEIGRKYPNTVVRLDLMSTIEPKVTVTKAGITLTCGGQVIPYAVLSDNSSAYLMTLNANMTAGVNVSLSHEKIFANIGQTDIKLHVAKSDVGHIKDAALQFIVDSILKVFVVPMLNSIGSKGFPLPVTDDIHFVNSSLRFVTDAVLVSTDVHYGA
ncbi:hypothetical protein FSP39_019464 [Pinctada imbricata]|uniref:Lipid-binding serum glycoprotein C-terminal domain-containing protein n=1 Tax=Pinctada imbricata TaxID=66713 RepID=A0AA88YLW1_PINIB|nr:hypothetical protein FSP39_019464 [Pinctada imbricata]